MADNIDNTKWESLTEATGQALGLASMAWKPTPQGEFDSQVAMDAQSALMRYIVDQYDSILEPKHSKGEAIVYDCLTGDEPFFVFRARDIFSIMAMKQYLTALENFGPDNPDFHKGIIDCINDFKRWQSENVTSVRYPD